MLRREQAAAIKRPNMLGEDEVLAAGLALAGPWGHVAEVLTTRRRSEESRATLARKLDVPAWQARVAITMQCRALLRLVSSADLGPEQRRRARAAVANWYVTRQRHRAARLVGKFADRLHGDAAPRERLGTNQR